MQLIVDLHKYHVHNLAHKKLRQPIRDVMTVAALHTGLSRKIKELGELLGSDTVAYSHGYTASELQDMFSKTELPPFVDKKELSAQLIRILELASKGLDERGKHEAHYLQPLYERAQSLVSPAKRMLDDVKNGRAMKDIIIDYSQL